jgi:4-diphosphocytidyl-2-C-methyl-D-erythritol kinase
MNERASDGGTTLRLRAHAKLNLALSVGGPVPPRGYHPIASWFVGIELHDTLELRRLGPGEDGGSRHAVRWAGPGDGMLAPCPTPIDWALDKDLAVRAHRLLEMRVGRELPVEMTIIKRTPVGGGLGGGSSDAAAALVGVDRLFGLKNPRRELAAMSVELGSDVAFFLDEPRGEARPGEVDDPGVEDWPRPALVTGFGETIERVDSPASVDVLLLLPPFGCPTAEVYRAFDAAEHGEADGARVRGLIESARPGSRWSARTLFNDLAGPACVVRPGLGDILRRLDGLSPHRVHVTGSGSTMFVIPEAGTGLEELAARVEALAPEVVVVKTRTL